jgi:hypothetical protein
MTTPIDDRPLRLWFKFVADGVALTPRDIDNLRLALKLSNDTTSLDTQKEIPCPSKLMN